MFVDAEQAETPRTRTAELRDRGQRELEQFGREICIARKPACPKCDLTKLCPFPNKTV